MKSIYKHAARRLTLIGSTLFSLSSLPALAQVDVSSVNLALGKAATQSSNYRETRGTANSAVDGDTNGVWRSGSITHTNTESQPWWEVDLGTVEDISDINLFNRTDC